MTCGHHLDDRRQRGRGESPPGLHMRELAVLQRLLTQAVALLEQQEIFLLHPDRGSVQCSAILLGPRLDGDQEFVLEQRFASIPGFPIGRAITAASSTPARVPPRGGGLALADLKIERWIMLLRQREQAREDACGATEGMRPRREALSGGPR